MAERTRCAKTVFGTRVEVACRAARRAVIDKLNGFYRLIDPSSGILRIGVARMREKCGRGENERKNKTTYLHYLDGELRSLQDAQKSNNALLLPNAAALLVSASRSRCGRPERQTAARWP